MINDWIEQSGKRCPMPEGSQISIAGTDIVIARDGKTEDYYTGSTCMVYSGHVLSGTGVVPGICVIIKEFYPISKEAFFDIERRKDGSLKIEDTTKQKKEYKEKWKQFEQGYEYQKELSGSNAMEIAVKPLFTGYWGDSFYIISDAHMGKDLCSVSPVSLSEKMAVAVSFAETMDILHENGYMMLDIKPENLLWIKKPNTVRIIDTDSIVAYNDTDRIRRQMLFANQNFTSPDIEFIRYKMQHNVSSRELEEVRKFFLKPNADRYTMGVFLYKIVFGDFPLFKDYSEVEEKKLLLQLKEAYPAKDRKERERIANALELLLGILKKLIIWKPRKREQDGYQKDKDIVSDLNEIYAMICSEKLVLRKDIAEANARFAAYNLLQKYPLFDYQKKNKSGISELQVSIIGKHVMRKDMLSAVISVGQMLEHALTVELVADDVEEFWKSYISEEQNSALAGAITWEVNGQPVSTDFDSDLVERSLAHIRVCSDDGYMPTAPYYILLEEDENRLQKWIEDIESLNRSEGQKIFVGILQNKFLKTKNLSENTIDKYEISSDAFTEYYSEKMFSEKIYQMGLMAHTYYSNGMKPGVTVDMETMEEDFRKDFYNIISSERCALHGIYKMASIGIDRRKPGRFLEYFRKIEQPEILEELAWLEHLSWTAFMLTSGAHPISMDKFNEYAYKKNNDWKDKSDVNHIGHPLLVASRKSNIYDLRMIASVKGRGTDVLGTLDPLDKVSWQIAAWYNEKKDDFKHDYCEWIEDMNQFCQKDKCSETVKDCMQQLACIGLKCIENVGNAICYQDTKNCDIWREKAKELESKFTGDEKGSVLMKRAYQIMNPVFHSYEDRDFKQYDRNLTFAVIDMIA